MKVVVTCGPGVVPIDEVRRITNFSTGELGALLANEFSAAGADVTCLKSVASTTELQLNDSVNRESFATNRDLERGLAGTEWDVILHAAALADFEIEEIRDDGGMLVESAKLSSRGGGLTLKLRPAGKVIAGLRARFPRSVIVGWKYELVGSRDDALSAARRQLGESRTDACVVNGAAFGSGFGLMEAGGALCEFRDKPELVTGLVKWVGDRSVS